jgi:nucleoside-diphosphate-sugar epimerase
MHAPKEMINHKTFYLCDYPPLNVRKWAELIRREMNSKKIPEYPIPLLKIVALVGDILLKAGWRRVPITSFRLNNLVSDMVYDTHELENICGPLPYDLETGVIDTVQWMKTHQNRDKLALISP